MRGVTSVRAGYRQVIDVIRYCSGLLLSESVRSRHIARERVCGPGVNAEFGYARDRRLVKQPLRFFGHIRDRYVRPTSDRRHQPVTEFGEAERRMSPVTGEQHRRGRRTLVLKRRGTPFRVIILPAEPQLESKAGRIRGRVPQDTLSLSKPPNLR